MAETDKDALHKRPHPQSMAGPYLELNLAREIEQLRGEMGSSTAHNAKTLAKYDDFRLVLMVLRAHARIPDHHTEGRISIETISGRIVVRAEGRTFDLSAGGLLVLDRGVPHDVEAREDSACLLTIAWRSKS